jgi:3-phosphoshikimate 1-carboxyvinyltransferase
VPPGARIRGRWRPPGDKSLSHRALLFAWLAGGDTELVGLNPGEDVERTARIVTALGSKVTRRGATWTVAGGPRRAPGRTLDCGNSGTTMRLLAGVLAALPHATRLTGDDSLSRRPMKRVIDPLAEMGARVRGRARGGDVYPPLRIDAAGAGTLRSAVIALPVASAQVKSALLLAATVGGVAVEVTEPFRSRDHTERMLRALGGRVRRVQGGVRVEPGGTLRAPRGVVPADPSAGAFFAAAAAGLAGSDLVLEDVCLNRTRLGFLRALARMGARVETSRRRSWCGEPVGDVRVRAGALRGVRIRPREVPSLLDELPVLAVLAAGASRGRTSVTGAAELRVKESDRIASLVEGLAALGADVREAPDGFTIVGGRLRGGTVDAHDDHRIAMAFRVAALFADGPVRVRGASCVRISHPSFARDLAALTEARR